MCGMNNRTLLPEQPQKAAACEAQSESFFLNKRPPPRPESLGKKRTRKTSLLFIDESLLLSLVCCCTFLLWKYVHFLFFHRFKRAKRKRQKWNVRAGAGVVVFEADFLLKFVRLVFFHKQP